MLHPYQILLPLLSLFLVRVDLTDLLPLEMRFQDLRILDGDTVSLQLPMGSHSLRLAKLDAPEKGQPFLDGRGDAGETSKRCAQTIIQQRKPQTIQVSGLDIYRRLLGDIEGLSLQLVKGGCTGLYPYAVFHSQQEKFIYVRALQEAKRKKRGLWARGGYLTPRIWRKISRGNAGRQ